VLFSKELAITARAAAVGLTVEVAMADRGFEFHLLRLVQQSPLGYRLSESSPISFSGSSGSSSSSIARGGPAISSSSSSTGAEPVVAFVSAMLCFDRGHCRRGSTWGTRRSDDDIDEGHMCGSFYRWGPNILPSACMNPLAYYASEIHLNCHLNGCFLSLSYHM